MTRGRGKSAAVMAFALLLGGGCARTPELVRGPIDISESVTAVRLDPPLPSPGPACELRFEFERPGDSHHAGKIHVAFVTNEGKRDTLTEVRLDRRGEATVSQIGHLESDSVDDVRSRLYSAIELWSDVPLRIGGIRGGGGK